MKQVDLAAWGLGAVSLYPLAGRLESLTGFFPPRFRSWFVVLSTIFSLLVYLRIQLSFSTLSVVLPVAWVGCLAAVLILGYIFLHISLKKYYEQLSSWRLAMAVIALLVLYCGAVMSLTYCFNVLDKLRTFHVFSGEVVLDTGERVEGADVVFKFGTQETPEPVRTGARGGFLKIVPEEKANQLTSLEASYRRGGAEWSLYSVAGDLPPTGPWHLTLRSGSAN